jgi:hypothetical protein
MAPTDDGRRSNPVELGVVGAACPADWVTPGLTRCCRVKPTGLGSWVEASVQIGSSGPRLEKEGARSVGLQ